jgi:hypothetical protein
VTAYPAPLALALLAIAVLLAGCAPEPIEPSIPPPVTAPGQTPMNACELAVVARAEFLRDQGAAGSERLESDIFESCTYAEFRAANAKMADDYRYTGDGRAYIGRNCVRLFALYRGSRLCQSR